MEANRRNDVARLQFLYSQTPQRLSHGLGHVSSADASSQTERTSKDQEDSTAEAVNAEKRWRLLGRLYLIILNRFVEQKLHEIGIPEHY